VGYDVLKSILATWPRDRDFPERAYELCWLRKVLEGSIYDCLPYQFDDERNGAGEYVPIRQRQPSVRYNLARTVVEDSVSLLFSEGHFPALLCDEEATREALEAVIKEARLDDLMVDAAIRGSVGSCAILLRVLKSRAFFEVLDTEFLTPTWQQEAPDTLECVTEKYKLLGRKLQEAGYDIPQTQLETTFWFKRVWTITDEEWYQPQPVALSKSPEAPAMELDASRSVRHGFGFVPIVWIRNLPGGKGVDGVCSFRGGVETQIEIEYQLSQGGRGLKYSSDPLLVIREPAASDGQIIRSAGNALVTTKDGDAKLLEIGGTATTAVIEYVRALREFLLEACHGNRAEPSKMSAAQSGRALELMNQGLIWLADRLRASYGEHGLLPLLRMLVKASGVIPLSIAGGAAAKLSDEQPITLHWPDWYPAAPEDKQADATTLTTLVGGGLMSVETAVIAIADTYDIEDVKKELASIQSDGVAADARSAQQAKDQAATKPVAK
jgi:hypothetical protein